MISKNELRRRLRLEAVDPVELLELLLHLAGSCRSLDDRRLVIPSPDDGPPRLVLLFTASGRLTDVQPGESLTEENLTEFEAAIREQLLGPTEPRVVRKVLYSSQPVEGYWRWRDRIVLRPLPEGNPQPPRFADSYPLIFEYAYLGPTDWPLSDSRGRRQAEQWMRVLALTAEHLTLPPRSPRASWATSMTQRPGENMAPESEWAHAHYQPMNWGAVGDLLAEQGNLPDMAVTDEHTGPYRCESSLHLPLCLPRCLTAFDTLDDSYRRKFLRAAHWIHHAARVRELSASAAYTAVVQSVEALIDTSGKQTSSPAFRAFVERYAPVTSGWMADQRRSLYRIRSQISHGSRLFVTDMELLGLPNPQRWHEDHALDCATAICRTAIINWLLTGPAAPPSR